MINFIKILIILLIIFLFLIIKKNISLNNEKYNNKNTIDTCIDKRNGISGCRDCCSQFPDASFNCVNSCMKY